MIWRYWAITDLTSVDDSHFGNGTGFTGKNLYILSLWVQRNYNVILYLLNAPYINNNIRLSGTFLSFFGKFGWFCFKNVSKRVR